MEEMNKLRPGTWDGLDTEIKERKEQLKWNVGDVHEVIMQCNEPKEFNGADGTFYLFDIKQRVNEDVVDKVIITSSWGLLRGMKENMPLMGKVLAISKKMVNNKQSYQVVDVNKPVVEDVVAS